MHDLETLFMREEEERRWTAEWENAAARMELAKIRKNCAHLISQHEPVASLKIDRERLRLVLAFIIHGDLKRLDRAFEELRVKEARENK